LKRALEQEIGCAYALQLAASIPGAIRRLMGAEPGVLKP